jgi:hypothetical protein
LKEFGSKIEFHDLQIEIMNTIYEAVNEGFSDYFKKHGIED